MTLSHFKTIGVLTNYTWQCTYKPCLLLKCESGGHTLLERGEQKGGALICSHVGEKSLSIVLGTRKQMCAFTDELYREVGETVLRKRPVLG